MENKVKVCVENLNVHYGEKQALFDVCMDINQNEITALIGPSGCGKSTFLRCLNRMNDVIDICKVEGSIKIDGQNIYCLLYTSPSPRDYGTSRMPSSA